MPYIRPRKSGVVVNFSSGASLEARDSIGAYAGAKATTDSESFSLFSSLFSVESRLCE